MTLVYTPRHVNQLISEIQNEWPPDDPDMHRVADAFPLHVLEKAYLRKLGAVSVERLSDRAFSVSQKLSTMRVLFQAWLSAPNERLGQLISNALFHRGNGVDLFYQEDGVLAQRVTEYTAKK